MKPLINLVLDSGAYSAFTQNAPIDISAYADFLLKNQRHLASAVNLDVILPGDPERAAKEGFDNFCYLRDRGCVTMPVFHVGESVKWIDKMLEQTDYIGLSSSMVSVAAGIGWYDMMFNYVTDKDGYPVARFHAFGDTTPTALLNYPWYSADSTTWVVAGGMAGRIFLNGQTIQFRSRMAKQGNFISKDDSGVQRESWESEFRRAGLDPVLCMNTEMRESDIMLIRTYMNAFHFLELQKKTESVTRFQGSMGLLDIEKKYGPGKPATDPVNLCFVLTESTSARALAVISQLGIKNILISKFFMGEQQWEERMVPYLYDPVGVCMADPKIRKEWEFLQRFIIEPTEEA